MKQLVMVSGKGGTGKTVLAASLAALAEDKVLADCDVDAANLELLLEARPIETQAFSGSLRPVLNLDRCSRCGECQSHCRYEAIDGAFRIDPLACEGCALCYHLCPEGAISLERHINGTITVSTTPFGSLVHARLGIAEENSGKLVSQVRLRARQIAEKEGKGRIFIDGPPGIGCSAIAAVSGADLALLLTEPSVAGFHDLDRILGLTTHFNIPAAVVINKFDIDREKSREIQRYCTNHGIEVLGKLPFDRAVVDAVVRARPVVLESDGPAACEMRQLWKRVAPILGAADPVRTT